MRICAAILFGLCLFVGGLRADQVEMQNGDRYAGKVVSMTPDAIVLQSDVLGKLALPRAKVANINLGLAPVAAPAAPPVKTTNQAPAAAVLSTNGSPDIVAALRNFGANTNFVAQIRKQFLSDAGPEANNKFDELWGGLLAGKVDINGLRAEAKSAADQIRALKQQGGDVGEPLDSYLAILDKFLKQTAPGPVPATNSPKARF